MRAPSVPGLIFPQETQSIDLSASLLVMVFATSLSGCGMVALNAVETVRGGENNRLIVKPINDLKTYQSISLAEIGGPVGKKLTPELLSYLNKKINQELSDRGAKVSKARQLRLSGTVLNIANSFRKKEILVQLKLHGIEINQPIGTVNVTGEAGGIRRIESAADQVAVGITNLLASYQYPGMIEKASWL
jgi:hypothetical protein